MFYSEIFWFGFSQGFIVGPITLFGIKEGLDPSRGAKYQLQVIAGATIVDFFYLTISTIGISHVIQNVLIQGFLWMAGAYLLIKMAINSFHERPHKLSFAHLHRKKNHFYEDDFFKAILLNLVNPMAIVFWLVVVGSMYADYHTEIRPIDFSLNILVAGALSSLVIVGLTFAVRSAFKPWMLQKLVQAGSLVLMGYGLWFTWKAATQIPEMMVGVINLF